MTLPQLEGTLVARTVLDLVEKVAREWRDVEFAAATEYRARGAIQGDTLSLHRRNTMNPRGPRYESHEYARRGKEVYERCVKPRLRPEDENKFIAIDIESDDFEIDGDDYQASERLLARRPDAQIWLERAGHRTAYRIGFRAKFGGPK